MDHRIWIKSSIIWVDLLRKELIKSVGEEKIQRNFKPTTPSLPEEHGVLVNLPPSTRSHLETGPAVTDLTVVGWPETVVEVDDGSKDPTEVRVGRHQ